MPARLQPVTDPRAALKPWRRAESLTDCFLYWTPVRAFPMSEPEREWMSEFHTRFSARAKANSSLRAEVFLRDTAFPDLLAPFIATSMEFSPLRGLGRVPGEPLPMVPYQPSKDARSVPPKMPGWYWFMNKAEERQRECFFGYGHTATIFLAPDPKTKAPRLPISDGLKKRIEALQTFDLQAMMNTAFASKDGFLVKSKEVFGGPELKDSLHLRGTQFVLPILSSTNFLRSTPEERAKWFELFDIYLLESPRDRGMLIASKHNLDDLICTLVEDMRIDGPPYPGEEGRNARNGSH